MEDSVRSVVTHSYAHHHHHHHHHHHSPGHFHHHQHSLSHATASPVFPGSPAGVGVGGGFVQPVRYHHHHHHHIHHVQMHQPHITAPPTLKPSYAQQSQRNPHSTSHHYHKTLNHTSEQNGAMRSVPYPSPPGMEFMGHQQWQPPVLDQPPGGPLHNGSSVHEGASSFRGGGNAMATGDGWVRPPSLEGGTAQHIQPRTSATMEELYATYSQTPSSPSSVATSASPLLAHMSSAPPTNFVSSTTPRSHFGGHPTSQHPPPPQPQNAHHLTTPPRINHNSNHGGSQRNSQHSHYASKHPPQSPHPSYQGNRDGWSEPQLVAPNLAEEGTTSGYDGVVDNVQQVPSSRSSTSAQSHGGKTHTTTNDVNLGISTYATTQGSYHTARRANGPRNPNTTKTSGSTSALVPRYEMFVNHERLCEWSGTTHDFHAEVFGNIVAFVNETTPDVLPMGYQRSVFGGPSLLTPTQCRSTPDKLPSYHVTLNEPIVSLRDIWPTLHHPYAATITLPHPVLLSPFKQHDHKVYYEPALSAVHLQLLGAAGEPAGSPFTWYAPDRPENRRMPLEQIELLAESDCPALLEAKTTDVSFDSWFSILWQPLYCHSHTPSRGCGAFLCFYVFRPARGISRTPHSPTDSEKQMGGEGTSLSADATSSSVLHTDLNTLGFDYWAFTADLATRVTSMDRIAADEPCVGVRIPTVGLIPIRPRTDVWYSLRDSRRTPVTFHAPLFLSAAALQLMRWHTEARNTSNGGILGTSSNGVPTESGHVAVRSYNSSPMSYTGSLGGDSQQASSALGGMSGVDGIQAKLNYHALTGAAVKGREQSTNAFSTTTAAWNTDLLHILKNERHIADFAHVYT